MTSLSQYKTFTGKSEKGRDRSYVIPEEKAKIVDFAIKLGKPLLIEGEAGCGKTRLADAVFDELDLKEKQQNKPLIIPVKSTSRANDLLYRYDALRRLQDSQASGKQAEKATCAYQYIQLEPLGRAIFEGWQCVIMIDEVDKADMDFANDLLHVLDRFEFLIDEMPDDESERCQNDPAFGYGRRVTGPKGLRPIVMFTSNREKQLPKPFLRRCFYLHLTFPDDPIQLAEIVQINLKSRAQESPERQPVLQELSSDIIAQAVDAFLNVRLIASQNNMSKQPSTAELIDWLHALHWQPETLDQLESVPPPYWELLFSTVKDSEIYSTVTGGE